MYQGSKWPFPDASPLKFNCVLVIIASFLFFIGWWIMIDANLQYTRVFDAAKIYHLPGVFATLAMICVNVVPSNLLYDSVYCTDRACCTPFAARTCLFVFLIASFGCLIGAGFILVYDFMLDQTNYQYPGYGIFIQNACIFSCSMLLRFAKRREMM